MNRIQKCWVGLGLLLLIAMSLNSLTSAQISPFSITLILISIIMIIAGFLDKKKFFKISIIYGTLILVISLLIMFFEKSLSNLIYDLIITAIVIFTGGIWAYFTDDAKFMNIKTN